MAELRRIIESVTERDVPLTNVLRHCLVLAAKLKNADLKNWALAELNGYPSKDSLPPYRILQVHAQGHFVGGYGAQIQNQGLPAGVLCPEHRDWATTAHLVEGIAAYEKILADPEGGRFVIPWSPDLVRRYSGSFFQGFTLASAWLEVPPGGLTAMIDTVRTRVLEFAIELQEAADDRSGDVDAIPPEQVDSSFVTIIYGGNNVVAHAIEGGVRQVGEINVTQGDFGSLAAVLQAAGVREEHVTTLKEAVDADRTADGRPSLGQRVSGWLSGVASGAIGGVTTNMVTPAVMAFFGIPMP